MALRCSCSSFPARGTGPLASVAVHRLLLRQLVETNYAMLNAVDYPLFARWLDEVSSKLIDVLRHPPAFSCAASTISEMACRHAREVFWAWVQLNLRNVETLVRCDDFSVCESRSGRVEADLLNTARSCVPSRNSHCYRARIDPYPPGCAGATVVCRGGGLVYCSRWC
jgi:hypothetical protein